MADSPTVIDDRLVVEELLVGLDGAGALHTTSLWYFRACRAAVLGAGGQLSGPFLGLDPSQQAAAIRSLLELRADIGLPDPRATVPVMAAVAERHPKLNVLNLEAVATAHVLDAAVLLSAPTSRGVLPGVLDAEHIDWATV